MQKRYRIYLFQPSPLWKSVALHNIKIFKDIEDKVERSLVDNAILPISSKIGNSVGFCVQFYVFQVAV
jgi:hypothetical protein